MRQGDKLRERSLVLESPVVQNKENRSNKSSLFLTILMLIRATSVRFFRLRAKFI